jgi:hypothetical protein
MAPIQFILPDQAPGEKSQTQGEKMSVHSGRHSSAVAPMFDPSHRHVSIAPDPMKKEWNPPESDALHENMRGSYQMHEDKVRQSRRQSTLFTSVTDTIMSLRMELKNRTSKPWYIIDPRSSPFISYWDTSTALALIFTAVVTPFEVAFLSGPIDPLDPLFIINRLIDLVFIMDMVFQFFIMYQRDNEEKMGEMGETTHWVHCPPLPPS